MTPEMVTVSINPDEPDGTVCITVQDATEVIRWRTALRLANVLYLCAGVAAQRAGVDYEEAVEESRQAVEDVRDSLGED